MAFVSFPVITNNPVYRNTMHISYVNPAYTIHKSSNKITANIAFSNFHQPFSGQPLYQRWHRELLVMPISCAKDSTEGAGGEDHQPDPRALETLLKLYNAMKNKNIVELSEIIADEPECVGNLSSIVQPLRGKKKVVNFFLDLIGHLGSEIEFFVKPTLHDGMMEVVMEPFFLQDPSKLWFHQLSDMFGYLYAEWNKTRTPFGKGFSLYTSHRYKGKLVIKNAEMFMEPLRHIPFRINMKGFMATLTEKIGSSTIFKSGTSKVVLCILLAFITAAFIISLMLTSP